MNKGDLLRIALHKDLEKVQDDVDKNQASISDASDTGEVTTEHERQVNASTRGKSTGMRSIVSASVDSETNTNTSAVIASSNSKIIDTEPKYRRNMVMLASDSFEFDPSSANDHKVIGGYNGDLAWQLDSRNGEVYAKDEIKVGDKKLSTMAKSSTIVIANYDSHKNSKASADIVIEKGENAATKINDAIQSLKSTGGEVKLMEGNYNLEYGIAVNVDNVHLTGIPGATILVQNSDWKDNPYNDGRKYIIDTKSDIENLRVTVSNLIVKGARVSGSSSFYCKGYSQVINCISEDIGVTGFYCSENSQITNCTSRSSEGNGFHCDENSQITNCTSESSKRNGFYCSENSQITNCTSRSSEGNGFFCSENSQITNCTSESSKGNSGFETAFTFKGVCSFNTLRGDKLEDSSSSPAIVEYNVIQEV